MARRPSSPLRRGLAFLLSGVLLAGSGPLDAQQAVPTPRSVLGFEVGADFHLATFEQSLEYFEALAAASDRVELVEVGRTSFGRPMMVAFVSSGENLRNLERHREIALRLAWADEDLDDAAARELAREGKAIVWIDGGLHATEVAHAQHTIQLAYDLVTGDDDPELRAILDEVILLLWPSINPDGQTMVADWYMNNVGTPFEVSSTPFLYQKYVGHDNNRDGYMINMVESRVATRVARDFEPQILYNHHQTAPFPTRIWIPPFAEPVSPRVHPLMWRTVNLMGMAMAQALEERGQKGATHMGSFDNWYPGFMDHANNFHNVASFLTETALYRYATPHFYTVDDFPASSRELRPQSLYASPWEGGWWRLRDAVDYMLTASFSVLDVAAKYTEDLLYNRYQAGRDVRAAYRDGPPYAWFVPREQRDPVAAAELLRRLAYNGIRIHELGEPATVDGIDHPAGTWVVVMDQPFANFVSQLFEVQSYPDLREYPEGPPDQPYDVAGWTLPYQMDVRVVEVRSPLSAGTRASLRLLTGDTVSWRDVDVDARAFDSPMGPGFDDDPFAAGVVPPPGRVEGGGSALHLDPGQNNTFKALNRAWDAGGTVYYAPGTPGIGGSAGTSGSYVVTDLSGDLRESLVDELHLRARGGGRSGTEVVRPRIGLYRPWQASMDEGWTRWLLESWEFDFESLYNADVLAGDLRGRYDVVVIPDMGARTLMEGYARGSVPERYAGGLGNAGLRELDAFVRAGGTLVTWNGSSEFAIERLHLPVRNAVDGLDRDEFFVSGSILEMRVDPSHPVMSGMPERARVMMDQSPAFVTEEGFEGRVFARYADEGSPLLSGYLLGEEHLRGLASGMEVRHGQGRVVLLGMRPQWRGQPFGTFPVVFNSLLLTGAVAESAPSNPDFWTAPEEEAEDVGGR